MPDLVAPGFDEWCVVELMGHRRVAARVTEHTLAGHGFLRLDEPDGRTQLVSPSSVYALHPTTEEMVRLMAGQWRSEPVSRWELDDAVVDRARKQLAAEDAAAVKPRDTDAEDEEHPF